MNKIAVIITIICLTLHNLAQAQSLNHYLKEPEVGKPCPEFVFTKIDFYKNKTVSLRDLRGKWIVLDFWSRFCSGCIASLPKVSQEQKYFKDTVQFIMVSRDSTTGERELYQKYHKNLKLAMPSAFDTELFHSFNVGLLPHTIIIDPEGIVRAVTTAPDPEKLKALIHGKKPVFTTASFENRKDQLLKYKHDYKEPFLVRDNGGPDSVFLFRSLLTKWRPGNPQFINGDMLQSGSYLKDIGRCELLGYKIDALYQMAYLGQMDIKHNDTALYAKVFPKPIFEIKDPLVLKSDFATGENLYCYSLTVPKADKKSMMKIMQNDLQNYFGYEVAIEKRKLPYWRLVVFSKESAGLKSKGGNTIVEDVKRAEQTRLRNCPMNRLLDVIMSFSGVSKNGEPLVDDTNIKENIDADFTWLKGNLSVVRKELQRHGLDIIKSEKLMQVVVIRDPKI